MFYEHFTWRRLLKRAVSYGHSLWKYTCLLVSLLGYNFTSGGGLLVNPVCQPPVAAEIDFRDLPIDFDPRRSEQMMELFGAPDCLGDCGAIWVEELEPRMDKLTECSTGQFIRRFRLKDDSGQEVGRCQQSVYIHPTHDYWIKFPADISAGSLLDLQDSLTFDGNRCDLFSVAYEDEIIEKKLTRELEVHRTYQVINWCEYDGQSPPVLVSRDENESGVPGDEAVYVVVQTINEPDPCQELIRHDQDFHYQHVWFDNDDDPFNKTDSFRGFWREIAPFTRDGMIFPSAPQYGTFHCETMVSSGYWQYTQRIKIELEEDQVSKGSAKQYGIEWRSKWDRSSSSGPGTELLNSSNGSIELLQNSPNPFSGETTVHFELSEATEIRLIVFNSRGRTIKECSRSCDAGSNRIGLKLDQDAPAGLYYYLLSDGRQTLGNTMVLQWE